VRLAALSDKRTASERRSDSGKKRRGVCRQGRKATDFGITTASAVGHVIPTPVRDNRQKPDVRSKIEFKVKRKTGEGGQTISNILQAGESSRVEGDNDRRQRSKTRGEPTSRRGISVGVRRSMRVTAADGEKKGPPRLR